MSQLVPPVDDETKYRLLKKGLDLAASYGLTSVHNAGFDEADLKVFERMHAGGRAQGAHVLGLAHGQGPDPGGPRPLSRSCATATGPRLPLRGRSRASWTASSRRRPPPCSSPILGGGTGLPNWTPEELNRTVALYDKQGFQVFLHAIGDRGIHMALDAYENAAKANGPRDRRDRVEHVEVPRFEDIPRFKALGVIASTQALFMYPNKNHLEVYVPMLGPERATRAMAFKTIDDSGAVQAFGSDWPVFSCEVLQGLHTAVTRKTAEGHAGGGLESGAEVTRGGGAAALHPRRGLRRTSRSRSRGTLAAGKLADLVVLSDDILAAPERILKAKVLLTVMGGQDTYRAREF